MHTFIGISCIYLLPVCKLSRVAVSRPISPIIISFNYQVTHGAVHSHLSAEVDMAFIVYYKLS